MNNITLIQRYELVFLFIIISASHIIGQVEDWPLTRTLRVIQEHDDSTVYKVKYDKEGAIKFLDQMYYSQVKGELYKFFEVYKKDKYWFIFSAKEVQYKTTDRWEKYRYESQGPSFYYDGSGKLVNVFYSENDKALPESYTLTYYPSGQLKDVFEYRKDILYNIVAYYLPDGSPYDFGDFKNGNGHFVDLNEHGEPCIECNMKRGIPKTARVLCDDQ